MTVLIKWAVGLACALILLGIIIDGYAVDVTQTQENLHSPRQIPNQIPSAVAEQQLVNGLALWQDKKYQQASQVFSSLNSKKLSANLQSLTELYQFHALAFIKNNNADFRHNLFTLPDDCKQQLLFVTPDIESLPQAERFRARFAKDPRFSSLSICIYNVTWFDPIDISCDDNWQQSGRLGCQLLPLAEKLKALPFTHVVMFADKGKANVHNGIMFLDRKDTYDVFIHELAHFSGFIDEYPLSQELAKRVCAGIDAPNMVFKQREQVKVDQHYWHSIGFQNDTDVFTARTCDNHPSQAFKASNQLTFMEYHDTAFIPAHYLTAWQKQLQKIPSQPSAHLNFAQLYEQSNNLAESAFWRTKYQHYLSSSVTQSTDL